MADTPKASLLGASILRWVPFGVLAVVALVLGYVGLSEHLRSQEKFGNGAFDILYYDLQLFLFAAEPVNNGGPFPLPLWIAMFAAPVATAYALFETVVAILAHQREQVRTLATRRHAIVCGGGGKGMLLTSRLRAAGSSVVVVDPRPSSDLLAMCRTRDFLVVVGDGSDAAVLRRAGARRASALYAVTPDSTTNAAIAVAARGVLGGLRRPLSCFALVGDGELRAALLARRIGASDDDRFRLHLFSADEIAAHALLAQEPVHPGPDGAPDVAIVGLNGFGRALTEELARQWRGRVRLGGEPLRLMLLDERAAAVARDLRRQRPDLVAACDLIPVTVDPATLDTWEPIERTGAARRWPPDRIYVCHGDHARALKLGLGLLRVLRDRRIRVTVCVGARGPELDQAFHGTAGRLFDDVQGSLRIFGTLEAAFEPAAIGRGVAIEEIARAIHDAYLATTVEQGDTPELNQAMRPWDELAEKFKESNRAQARDIGRKLQAINCIVVPQVDPSIPFAFRSHPDEVEQLARMEHARWMRERLDLGYRHGPRREGMFHPDLVDWAALTEQAREKDRAFIRALPGILSSAGFQILRLPTEASQAPGARQAADA